MTTSSSATDAGDDVVPKKYMYGEEGDTILGGKLLPRLLADFIVSPNRRPAIIPILSCSKAKLVHDGRRQCGDQRSCHDAWGAADRTIVPAGPIRDAGLCGLGPVSFPRSAEGGPVVGVEIMVDTDVVVIPICVLSVAIRNVLAFDAAEPPMPRYVQAIA